MKLTQIKIGPVKAFEKNAIRFLQSLCKEGLDTSRYAKPEYSFANIIQIASAQRQGIEIDEFLDPDLYYFQIEHRIWQIQKANQTQKK